MDLKSILNIFFRQYKEKNSLSKEKPAWIFKLVVFFIAETKTKEIKLSPEHIGFEWLPIEEAIKKTTFKNSKKLLREADDFVKKNNLL